MSYYQFKKTGTTNVFSTQNLVDCAGIWGADGCNGGSPAEAMEYIQQLADPDEAEIFMGHVTRDSEFNEVYITVLAAGMPVGAKQFAPEVMHQPKATTAPQFISPQTPAPIQEPAGVAAPGPITMDEIDLDIPTFLRRQKLGN